MELSYIWQAWSKSLWICWLVGKYAIVLSLVFRCHTQFERHSLWGSVWDGRNEWFWGLQLLRHWKISSGTALGGEQQTSSLTSQASWLPLDSRSDGHWLLGWNGWMTRSLFDSPVIICFFILIQCQGWLSGRSGSEALGSEALISQSTKRGRIERWLMDSDALSPNAMGLD